MRTSRIISALTALCLALVLASCSQQKAETPSYKDAVKQAMDQNGFNKVTVDEDRDKGVVTLGGKVQSDDEKARAEEAAKAAAPGEVIAMEISVEPPGSEGQAKNIESNIDTAIEHNFKAALIGNKLEDQKIDYKAKNGVLTLSGTVKTPQQRAQAEKIATSIPNVEQVVNELEVKHGKAPATQSQQPK
ncbi:MAG TPA: BON domain-containing protein [Terriglobales bacterium]|nr:BON domain-containing protein [Terriglobales bacterium]